MTESNASTDWQVSHVVRLVGRGTRARSLRINKNSVACFAYMEALSGCLPPARLPLKELYIDNAAVMSQHMPHGSYAM